MTKILLTFTLLFASCFEVEVKPREIIAQSVFATHVSYQYKEVSIRNMQYGIWIADYRSGGGTAAICVVNLTKDALECELLVKQINDKNTSK